MEVVWNQGECTVHSVIERLPGRRKPAYSTILTVLQKLEQGGWLRHRQEGRTYVYKAARSREEVGSRTIRQMIRQIFRGDTRAFMQQLVKGEHLSDQELSDLQRMIDEHRRR